MDRLILGLQALPLILQTNKQTNITISSLPGSALSPNHELCPNLSIFPLVLLKEMNCEQSSESFYPLVLSNPFAFFKKGPPPPPFV